MSGKKAVVLLSGGMDSATTLYEARAQGFDLHALVIDYGQRHRVELELARRIAQAAGVTRVVEQKIDLREFGGSALTSRLAVPKDRDRTEMASGIPITYVPARNTVFLSLALAWAETLSAFDLFLGVNCLDYSGYPDCRPEFLRAFEQLANLATKAGVGGEGVYRIHAPFLQSTKEQILRRGLELGVDYGMTHSCYDPDPSGRSCGRCDSCRLRLEAFQRVGILDPIPYVE